ncbi:hypothetical protein D3C78_1117720 [compost metagenome]
MLNKVVILRIHTNNTLAASLLAAIGCNRKTLDIARMGNGDDNILTRNKILVQYFLITYCNFCTTLIAEAVF